MSSLVKIRRWPEKHLSLKFGGNSEYPTLKAFGVG